MPLGPIPPVNAPYVKPITECYTTLAKLVRKVRLTRQEMMLRAPIQFAIPSCAQPTSGCLHMLAPSALRVPPMHKATMRRVLTRVVMMRVSKFWGLLAIRFNKLT